jgi:hypothetical protein
MGIHGNGWEWMGMDGELDVSIDIFPSSVTLIYVIV